MRACSLLFFLLLPVCSMLCQTMTKTELEERIASNKDLFQTNIDVAYSQINFLLKEAEFLKDTLSELTLLDRRCRYFYSKSNTEKLIDASDNLRKKAIEYKSINDQAMSSIYLAEVFSTNGLYDKALSELNRALSLTKENGSSNTKNILTRVNILTSFCNVYIQKKEPKEAAQKLYLAIEEFKNINDSTRIKTFQHLNYSNLATVYTFFDMDSARYYALLSMNIHPKGEPDIKIMAQNYFVLGKAYENKGDTTLALNYYLKAYDINKKIGEELNAKEIYTALIGLYTGINDTISAKKFETLLKESELNTLQSNYNSMHKVLNMEENSKSGFNMIPIFLILIGSTICILVVILYFRFFRRNKKNNSLDKDNYNMILDMIKRNDLNFMLVFEQFYPDFSQKILATNPKLTRSEIEFCALLKLNLSTKQIAQLRFIEIRTVQNRKHRIRKKLDIPATTDLYNWFDSF